MSDENNKSKEQVSLYQYVDYRQFLSRYYTHRKKDDTRFSYRAFSRKAGFVSPSYLLDVIKGEKNISLKSIDGVCRALGLNARERLYFENLVRFNQSNTTEAKRHYYEQLAPYLKKESGSQLSKDQYLYFSQWYAPVIREMVNLDNFKEDPKWMSWKLRGRVTPLQAKKALQLLFNLKMVERDDEGRLRATETNLTTPNEVAEVVMVKFHKEMLLLARESVEHDEGDHREISGITAALTSEQFKAVKTKIQEFQDTLMHELIETNSKASEVYQINFQFFALTNQKEDSKS
jgi:uncharacterized protein (TIGR02147 family)